MRTDHWRDQLTVNQPRKLWGFNSLRTHLKSCCRWGEFVAAHSSATLYSPFREALRRKDTPDGNELREGTVLGKISKPTRKGEWVLSLNGREADCNPAAEARGFDSLSTHIRMIVMPFTGEQRRLYTNEYRTLRRVEVLTRFGNRCQLCGAISDLQFDHIDRSTKVHNISKMWTASKEKFDAELAKCQLLCGDCHKKKTRDCDDIPPPKPSLGEDHGMAKLNADDVRSIRSRYSSGEATVTELAREYRVSRGTINPIVNYKTWRCVE